MGDIREIAERIVKQVHSGEWEDYVEAELQTFAAAVRQETLIEAQNVAWEWQKRLPRDYNHGIRKLVWQEVSGYIACGIRDLPAPQDMKGK